METKSPYRRRFISGAEEWWRENINKASFGHFGWSRHICFTKLKPAIAEEMARAYGILVP